MNAIINMSVPRERLTFAIDHAPNHWRPLMVAIRDAGISVCVVPQGGERFAPPKDRPSIVVIGDDMLTSMGPDAFHAKSLRRFVRTCNSAVIVACAPLVIAYASAAAVAAGLRQNVIIVETKPEHEADWKSALDAIKPNLNFIICTIKPAGGVH